MKKLTKIFIVFGTYSIATLYANDQLQDEKSIDQKLESLKIEKIQAVLMIEAMGTRGKLDTDQVSRAKREVASIKEADVLDLKTEALERLSSKHSYATK